MWIEQRAVRLFSMPLAVFLLSLPWDTVRSSEETFRLKFENTEIQTVIKEVSELTGVSFIFDPEQVKGRMTLVTPGKVSAEEALWLLKRILATYGYSIRRYDETRLILPAQSTTAVEIIRLQYADAEKMASILARIAPHGVGIIPHRATNSLIIYGDPQAIKALRPIAEGQGSTQRPLPDEGGRR